MKASNYYALRCAVVEAFWDAVAGEKLTLGQAAGRCLVEFTSELAGIVTPPVGVPRLWNTSNIAFATFEAEALLLLLSVARR